MRTTMSNLANAPSKQSRAGLFDRFLAELRFARCSEIALHAPNKDKAVSLRHRLNEMRKEMQSTGALGHLAKNATIRAIYTTADGQRHSYSNDSSISTNEAIRSWEVNIELNLKAEDDAVRADLLS
jgi:hypothetical protein